MRLGGISLVDFVLGEGPRECRRTDQIGVSNGNQGLFAIDTNNALNWLSAVTVVFTVEDCGSLEVQRYVKARAATLCAIDKAKVGYLLPDRGGLVPWLTRCSCITVSRPGRVEQCRVPPPSVWFADHLSTESRLVCNRHKQRP